MRISEKIFGFLKPDRKTVDSIPGYDPETCRPVIRCSICTGEQTAGYIRKGSTTFHEVMLIRDENDLAEFKRLAGKEEIEKEY